MPRTDLVERLLAGERAAVSQALNLIDDQRPAQIQAAEQLQEQLEERGEATLRAGITGAPGAGKSTLIDSLVRELRGRDLTVGIIAVDPSSSKSGGALLGDRVRVRSRSSDPGVFIRSMAARSRLGGVADATRASVDILAAVFDVVLIETVGVGQSESDIRSLVETLIFVAQPTAGDTLQFMKAGLIELPDIFVVNKADQGPAADRTKNELSAGMGLGDARADGWEPPVLLASARDGVGIGEIADAMLQHREHLETSDELTRRRRSGKVQIVLEALERRFGSFGIETTGGRDALAERVKQASRRSIPLITRTLGAEIERRLRAAPQ
jgi:LAO/AO transport system kinase